MNSEDWINIIKDADDLVKNIIQLKKNIDTPSGILRKESYSKIKSLKSLLDLMNGK